MKEIILLFVGDYKSSTYIPDLKREVKEYLGKRMITDECLESPILKLNQALTPSDVSGICQIVSNCPGNSLSVLYITNDKESDLSRLFIELKPAI